MSISIPIKILHDAVGHIITLETKIGVMFRGRLVGVEDNMNCQITGVSITDRDGRVSQTDLVYIRGSNICFFIFPDVLEYSPMLNRVTVGRGTTIRFAGQGARARGRGRARATIPPVPRYLGGWGGWPPRQDRK
ncbi:hypothetical protein FQR65_LT01007 [Abscondita terminalis]|nr:hypothetical protein FQR65_LT01007 [Abscondita terminalis]